jgi:hypothetical protein
MSGARRGGGAGDEPVLRFDCVVLAPGPVGLVAGAFDGRLERLQCCGVRPFGVGGCLTGRGQGGRLQDDEAFA